MTINTAARIALEVQDACNLSGVTRSFVDILDCLWKEARKEGHGTEWVNQHPISKLFTDKMQSLAGECKLADYDACERLQTQKEVVQP